MRSATDHRGRHRVAITGLGVKAPGGLDRDEFWDTLAAGRSTAATIERFDASELPVRIACEVTDFDAEAYVSKKEARRLDRVTQLGVAAAADAYVAAQEPQTDPARCAVVEGSGIGGLSTLEDNVRAFMTKGPGRVSPFFVPMMMPNATAAAVAMRLGWTGPNLCISTACAAGANAIGESARLIRNRDADTVLAIGTEAVITPVCVAAFARMTALSGRNDEPELASRPFDSERDGFVMGEGAAALVLERWDQAEARGAPIVAELVGYGCNSDAYHITAPSPGGEGAAACMQLALADAGFDPIRVGHINAHGTSTPLNDAAEAAAIVKVFGDSAPPVTSVKGATGHLIGAAGAVEAVAAIESLQRHAIPPTANLNALDPEIHLDVVRGDPRPFDPAPVVSNSFGFGGHNASLIFAPIEAGTGS